MRAGGYRAIDSLRLEKGYRVWAADITPDETPHEAGLSFAVRDDKEFIGSDALAAAEPEHMLRCITLDDPSSVALGNEPVRVDGEVCGRVTSGGYGYTVERSIAYAYLPVKVDVGAEVQIDIFGQWVAGEVATEPLFDPRGERVRSGAGAPA
jgi:4-methylaminobutanoate oxidase (formaldehyde-forming)